MANATRANATTANATTANATMANGTMAHGKDALTGEEWKQKLRFHQHNPGYDYHGKGIYHITLVVGGRDKLLGRLNMDPREPGVILSDLGQRLWNQWEKTPALQAKHGNKVRLLAQVVMPDHWHGVLEVEEEMSWSLGDIIQAVKASITSQWRKMTGYIEPRSVAESIRNMTHEERQAYYPTRPRHERPLFDDDFDDTICLHDEDGSYSERHLQAMINYVHDNPRRAIIIKTQPDFMQKIMHIVIDGRDYAAFGNLFLLRWAKKEQVFCHRRARLWQLTEEERHEHGYTYAAVADMETRVPYETTAAFRKEHDAWKTQLQQGITVLVTPGKSEGEKQMKNECLAKGYPLIHIQENPITRYWKPEAARFAACEHGTLLILAPWNPESMGDVNGVPSETTYSIFHNLNTVAAEICAFHGKAVVRYRT